MRIPTKYGLKFGRPTRSRLSVVVHACPERVSLVSRCFRIFTGFGILMLLPAVSLALVMAEASHAGNVWIDSNWLPNISYTMAKRAFHEWLEEMSSNRIMWGTDSHHAEGIYSGAEMTRRCLAEVLSEKIERGDLTMEEAQRIGRQIMRDNALALFPQLRGKLWKN